MKVWIGAAALAALGVGLLFYTERGREAQFVFGGAMVDAGIRMQDRLERYDFAHEEDISPEQIWNEIVTQNEMASRVRETFPRSTHHPLVALVACMDARIDTNDLMGDTRKYYYVIRTAGSVLEQKEEEMLELAVDNGVKVIVLTTHSDCAAEKASTDEVLRQRLPALTRAVDERERRIHELLERPAIKSRIEAGTLLVKLVDIDTMTERMLPSGAAHTTGTSGRR